jgi:hypothetical protein
MVASPVMNVMERPLFLSNHLLVHGMMGLFALHSDCPNLCIVIDASFFLGGNVCSAIKDREMEYTKQAVENIHSFLVNNATESLGMGGTAL